MASSVESLHRVLAAVAIASVSLGARGCVSSDARAMVPPAHASAPTPPVAPVRAPVLRLHRVNGPRDTLSVIAARYHVSGGAAELARINGIRHPSLFSARGILVPDHPPFTDGLPVYAGLRPVASTLRACSLTRASRPQSATIDGCDRASCTTLTNGSRVCGCVSPDDGARDLELRVIDRRGRVRERLPFASFLGDVSAFDVREGDIDGDGTRDRAIATLSAVSNGMSVTSWRIAIARENGRERVELDVQEYGEGTFVARPSGQAGCDLLATSWEWHEDVRRGVGLYLVGRSYRWRRGALVPTGEVRGRRLLESFASEREASCASASFAADACAEPAEWLASRGAESFAIDPVFQHADERETRRGSVVAVEREGNGGESALAFHLRTSRRGPTWRVRELRALGFDEPDDQTWTRLGDARTRVLFPIGYLPSSPRTAFVGRDVTLESTVTSRYDRVAVMWIGR